MVATAMSNVRRTTYLSPDPLIYARSAVATIGIQDYTHGYWPHAFQVIFACEFFLFTLGNKATQCGSAQFHCGVEIVEYNIYRFMELFTAWAFG